MRSASSNSKLPHIIIDRKKDDVLRRSMMNPSWKHGQTARAAKMIMANSTKRTNHIISQVEVAYLCHFWFVLFCFVLLLLTSLYMAGFFHDGESTGGWSGGSRPSGEKAW